MFHPRPLPAPDLEAQRLAWANEDAARQARVFAEMYPSTAAKPERVADPMSFCRYCHGKGHTFDVYGIAVEVAPCETCAGTGWR